MYNEIAFLEIFFLFPTPLMCVKLFTVCFIQSINVTPLYYEGFKYADTIEVCSHIRIIKVCINNMRVTSINILYRRIKKTFEGLYVQKYNRASVYTRTSKCSNVFTSGNFV